MDNLDDLKNIWHSARTDSLPDSQEMLSLVRRFRNQKLRSKWLVITVSCLLSSLIIVVLFIVNFKLITTYAGGALMAASGLLLAATNIRSSRRFYRLDDCSNREFLAFIEQTRLNQIFYYKKTMVVIVLMGTCGLLLYLYEPVHKHTQWFIGIYSVILVYLGILWFVVRPRSFKKDAEKLRDTLQRLESISKQLK